MLIRNKQWYKFFGEIEYYSDNNTYIMDFGLISDCGGKYVRVWLNDSFMFGEWIANLERDHKRDYISEELLDNIIKYSNIIEDIELFV